MGRLTKLRNRSLTTTLMLPKVVGRAADLGLTHLRSPLTRWDDRSNRDQRALNYGTDLGNWEQLWTREAPGRQVMGHHEHISPAQIRLWDTRSHLN